MPLFNWVIGTKCKQSVKATLFAFGDCLQCCGRWVFFFQHIGVTILGIEECMFLTFLYRRDPLLADMHDIRYLFMQPIYLNLWANWFSICPLLSTILISLEARVVNILLRFIWHWVEESSLGPVVTYILTCGCASFGRPAKGVYQKPHFRLLSQSVCRGITCTP